MLSNTRLSMRQTRLYASTGATSSFVQARLTSILRRITCNSVSLSPMALRSPPCRVRSHQTATSPRSRQARSLPHSPTGILPKMAGGTWKNPLRLRFISVRSTRTAPPQQTHVFYHSHWARLYLSMRPRFPSSNYLCSRWSKANSSPPTCTRRGRGVRLLILIDTSPFRASTK